MLQQYFFTISSMTFSSMFFMRCYLPSSYEASEAALPIELFGAIRLATMIAVMPATSFPTIIGNIISLFTPAVNPRWSPNTNAALTAKATLRTFPLLSYILHQPEHRDVVCKSGYHAGSRDIIHAKHFSEL